MQNLHGRANLSRMAVQKRNAALAQDHDTQVNLTAKLHEIAAPQASEQLVHEADAPSFDYTAIQRTLPHSCHDTSALASWRAEAFQCSERLYHEKQRKRNMPSSLISDGEAKAMQLPRYANRFRKRPLHHRSHDQQFLGRWVEDEVADLVRNVGDSDSDFRDTRNRLLALGLECSRQLDARESRLAGALYKAMEHNEKIINAILDRTAQQRNIASRVEAQTGTMRDSVQQRLQNLQREPTALVEGAANTTAYELIHIDHQIQKVQIATARMEEQMIHKRKMLEAYSVPKTQLSVLDAPQQTLTELQTAVDIQAKKDVGMPLKDQLSQERRELLTSVGAEAVRARRKASMAACKFAAGADEAQREIAADAARAMAEKLAAPMLARTDQEQSVIQNADAVQVSGKMFDSVLQRAVLKGQRQLCAVQDLRASFRALETAWLHERKKLLRADNAKTHVGITAFVPESVPDFGEEMDVDTVWDKEMTSMSSPATLPKPPLQMRISKEEQRELVLEHVRQSTGVPLSIYKLLEYPSLLILAAPPCVQHRIMRDSADVHAVLSAERGHDNRNINPTDEPGLCRTVLHFYVTEAELDMRRKHALRRGRAKKAPKFVANVVQRFIIYLHRLYGLRSSVERHLISILLALQRVVARHRSHLHTRATGTSWSGTAQPHPVSFRIIRFAQLLGIRGNSISNDHDFAPGHDKATDHDDIACHNTKTLAVCSDNVHLDGESLTNQSAEEGVNNRRLALIIRLVTRLVRPAERGLHRSQSLLPALPPCPVIEKKHVEALRPYAEGVGAGPDATLRTSDAVLAVADVFRPLLCFSTGGRKYSHARSLDRACGRGRSTSTMCSNAGLWPLLARVVQLDGQASAMSKPGEVALEDSIQQHRTIEARPKAGYVRLDGVMEVVMEVYDRVEKRWFRTLVALFLKHAACYKLRNQTFFVREEDLPGSDNNREVQDVPRVAARIQSHEDDLAASGFDDDDGMTGCTTLDTDICPASALSSSSSQLLDYEGFHTLVRSFVPENTVSHAKLNEIFLECCNIDREERLRRLEAAWETIPVSKTVSKSDLQKPGCTVYFQHKQTKKIQWSSPFAVDEATTGASAQCCARTFAATMLRHELPLIVRTTAYARARSLAKIERWLQNVVRQLRAARK